MQERPPLRCILSQVPGQEVINRLLDYDAAGRISRADDLESGLDHCYSYDGVGRLTRWYDCSSSADKEVFSFQAGGVNKSTMQGITGSLETADLFYANTSYPWAVTKKRVYSGGGYTDTNFAYSSDGLMTGKGNKAFEYNARMKVRKAIPDSFHYTRWYYDHTGSVATKYDFQSWPSVVFNFTDYVGPFYEKTKSLLPGPSISYLFIGGMRIASKKSSEGYFRYYHADEKGSVRRVTNQSGTVLETHHDRSYGQEYYPLGGGPNGAATYKFNDRRDEGNGHLRFHVRNLDTDDMQWSGIDTVALVHPGILLAEGVNPFAYAGHDPINRMDSTGGTVDHGVNRPVFAINRSGNFFFVSAVTSKEGPPGTITVTDKFPGDILPNIPSSDQGSGSDAQLPEPIFSDGDHDRAKEKWGWSANNGPDPRVGANFSGDEVRTVIGAVQGYLLGRGAGTAAGRWMKMAVDHGRSISYNSGYPKIAVTNCSELSPFGQITLGKWWFSNEVEGLGANAYRPVFLAGMDEVKTKVMVLVLHELVHFAQCYRNDFSVRSGAFTEEKRNAAEDQAMSLSRSWYRDLRLNELMAP